MLDTTVSHVVHLFRHFKLLVDHHTAPNALVITCSVLNLIKQFMFKHSFEDNSIRGVGLYKLMQELFEASNFGVSNTAPRIALLMLVTER